MLARLLEQRTGQRLAADREWRIDTAIRPLLAALDLDHADALAARLEKGGDAGLEERVVDALLNQETSFFRDAGVIESAVEAVRGAAVPGARQRIWCAACATGQEPLSLAMLFAEAGGTMPEILATDVSAGAIARARSGAYSHFEIQRGLPIRRMMRWFGDEDGKWIAAPELTGMISFRRQNLVADPAPAGGFDLILCRNVLFYLSPGAREQVLARLAKALRPDGLLLLGAGETVIGQSALLRPSARARGLYERMDRDAAGPPRVYT
ncbi:chemotaxis protein CheR [Sphingomonas sp. Leaf412]|nr:chemotaxis protein CheR [Sphingomonas sp. Leaf412]